MATGRPKLMDIYSEAQWSWIGDRWAEGVTIDAMSYFLDLSPYTIKSILHQLGYKQTGGGFMPMADGINYLERRKQEFNGLYGEPMQMIQINETRKKAGMTLGPDVTEIQMGEEADQIGRN